MVDDEVQSELTRRLIDGARKLDIPMPSDYWVQSTTTGINYWNEDARYNVAQQIRKEKKERRDYHLSFWKDVALLVTAIVAIVSSIWSILKK
jgi:hypothetical protein